MVPIISLTGQVDWMTSIASGTGVGLAWFAAALLSALADSRKGNRTATANTVRFPAQSFVSGIYASATIGSAWLALAVYREGEPLWLQRILLGFGAIACYGWPRTITCGPTEVSQRSALLFKRRIPYVSVEAISVGGDGTTTVLGAATTIEHTAHHVDGEGFGEVMSRRNGKPVY